MSNKSERPEEAQMTDAELASVVLLEMLKNAHRGHHDLLHECQLPPGREQKVREAIKTRAERAMVPLLRFLHSRGHEVSGYNVRY